MLQGANIYTAIMTFYDLNEVVLTRKRYTDI